jgi:hypothetical protein
VRLRHIPLKFSRVTVTTSLGCGQSPSRITRFYGDLGWKGSDAEVHLVASAADNFFGVVGPTPVELLNNDYRSIFTWPQTTRDRAQLLALNGRYAPRGNVQPSLM